ncbi:MAG: DUF3459 domain-containing protein, partial [Actinomycetota bacterium]|nr:DUF3459 domain-containing protein [Actinomycetota bacterium]
ILHLYRRLLHARHQSAALQLGQQDLLVAPQGVLCIRRMLGDEQRVIFVNFTDAETDTAVPAPGKWVVVVASDGCGEGVAYTGVLGPDQAVLLAPA